jgi:hypothetical protein
LILVAFGALGQISEQLEANKYGVTRQGLTKLRLAAESKGMDVPEYITLKQLALSKGYPSVDEHLLAQKNGFTNSSDWENAKKLKVDSYERYLEALRDMRSRGISSIDEYIDELSDERKNPMENLKTLIRRAFFLITIL